MSYFTAQELYTYLTTGCNIEGDVDALARIVGTDMEGIKKESVRRWYGDEHVYRIDTQALTVESCAYAIEALDESLIEGMFTSWKALRPWTVVPITDSLDPNKAWIGWEVETGWNNEEHRSRVIEDFLSTFNHVCTDEEGAAFGVELTWCPREADAYVSEEEHPLMFVTKYVRCAYKHDPEDYVGTHINVSTPAFRTTSSDVKAAVCSALNRTLNHMSGTERERLFGRACLYGGFLIQGDDTTNNTWLEGKLFNSTYSKPVARGYIAVGNRIAELVEALTLAIQDSDTNGRGTTIDNAYGFLSGLAAVPSIVVAGGVGMCYYDDDYDDEDVYDDNGAW